MFNRTRERNISRSHRSCVRAQLRFANGVYRLQTEYVCTGRTAAARTTSNGVRARSGAYWRRRSDASLMTRSPDSILTPFGRRSLKDKKKKKTMNLKYIQEWSNCTQVMVEPHPLKKIKRVNILDGFPLWTLTCTCIEIVIINAEYRHKTYNNTVPEKIKIILKNVLTCMLKSVLPG